MDSYLFLKKSNIYFTFFKISLRDCLNSICMIKSGNISFGTLCKWEFFNQNTSVSQSNTFPISKLKKEKFYWNLTFTISKLKISKLKKERFY